jgi:hypothetical protein
MSRRKRKEKASQSVADGTPAEVAEVSLHPLQTFIRRWVHFLKKVYEVGDWCGMPSLPRGCGLSEATGVELGGWNGRLALL